MIFGHLLEVRDRPVAIGRIAEEPALDVVVGPTRREPVHRVRDDLEEPVVAGRAILAEQKLVHVGLWELRRLAETAVLRIVVRQERRDHGLDHRDRQIRTVGGRVVATPAAQFDRALRDLLGVGRIESGDLVERAAHLRRRKVGRAGDGRAVGCEKRGRRPAAHVVARVDVGTFVVVDADRHVLLADRREHGRIGIAGLVHDVTPVAPHRRDREQDRPVEDLRARERLGRPRLPIDLVRAIGTWGEMQVTHRLRLRARTR